MPTRDEDPQAARRKGGSPQAGRLKSRTAGDSWAGWSRWPGRADHARRQSGAEQGSVVVGDLPPVRAGQLACRLAQGRQASR
jgi:hypothetical protein